MLFRSFRTANWDTIVAQNLQNPTTIPGLLAPNDGSPNFPKIATHGFVTRKMTEILGYLLPPYFESEFCDTWITEIALESNILHVQRQVLIEHLHPSWGKASFDDTYNFRKQKLYFFELFLFYKLLSRTRKREIRNLRFCLSH